VDLNEKCIGPRKRRQVCFYDASSRCRPIFLTFSEINCRRSTSPQICITSKLLPRYSEICPLNCKGGPENSATVTESILIECCKTICGLLNDWRRAAQVVHVTNSYGASKQTFSRSTTDWTHHGDLPRIKNDGGSLWKRLRYSQGLDRNDDEASNIQDRLNNSFTWENRAYCLLLHDSDDDS